MSTAGVFTVPQASAMIIVEENKRDGHGHSHGSGHGHSHDEPPAEASMAKRKTTRGENFRKNYDACRLVSMMGLTASFMIVELVFGFMTGSLALISDAFHMLSDLQGLIIGFAAVQLSKKKSSNSMSYGWARAEIVGGLMNGCFLLAICGFIFLEAIERLLEGAHVSDPLGVIIVGGIGLLINVVGLFIFGHGHSHGGGHGHSHGGGHGHSHGGGHGHSHGDGAEHCDSDEHEGHTHPPSDEEMERAEAGSSDEKAADTEGKKKKKKKAHENLNMRGVFLHVLGDALGSVGVVISGLIILLFDWEYRHYVDTAISVIIAGIILFTTIPLVKRSAQVLLQSSPANINMVELLNDLQKTKGVTSIHDLHVWQLINQTVISSVHITLDPDVTFSQVAPRVKKVFHKHHIHASTIQPEEIADEVPAGGDDEKCRLLCSEDCESKEVCCTTTKLPEAKKRRTRRMSKS